MHPRGCACMRMEPDDGTKAGTKVTARGLSSGASSSCWRAALALVRTAPRLLGHRPTCHPIREARLAVVWLGYGRSGGCDCGTPTALIRTTLPMHSTAPLLFGNRPTRLPIGETVLAIVGICWAWWFCRLTTDVMMVAAPCLLALVPTEVRSHRAIVRIDRSGRRWGCCGRSRGRRSRGSSCRLRGWRSGRWCGWLRGKWSGWHRRCGLRQSCCGATTAHCGTAVILLCLRPWQLCSRSEAGIAIVRQRCRRARQQPTQKRNQQ